MTPAERLAAAMADHFPRGWLRGRFNSPAFEYAAEQILAADPTLAAALEVGLAVVETWGLDPHQVRALAESFRADT